MADTDPIPVTVEVVSDDGAIRVERVMHNGREIGRNVVSLPSPEEQAEQAAVERHRDVLRQQLDPKRPDPSSKEIADAQAFITLAADVGVAEALAVADEVVAIAVDLVLPVDPRLVDPKQPKG